MRLDVGALAALFTRFKIFGYGTNKSEFRAEVNTKGHTLSSKLNATLQRGEGVVHALAAGGEELWFKEATTGAIS